MNLGPSDNDMSVIIITSCSAVVEHSPCDHEVVGSNPASSIFSCLTFLYNKNSRVSLKEVHHYEIMWKLKNTFWAAWAEEVLISSDWALQTSGGYSFPLSPYFFRSTLIYHDDTVRERCSDCRCLKVVCTPANLRIHVRVSLLAELWKRPGIQPMPVECSNDSEPGSEQKLRNKLGEISMKLEQLILPN